MRVPYSIIIEAQEYDQYAAVIDPKKILVLDKRYQRDYDTCDPGGDAEGMSKGSGAARNFAWDHSISIGAPWHWCIDDNIRNWMRLNKNIKIPLGDGTGFKCMEDFVLRYCNIAMAGPQYDFFAPARRKWPPFVANTRIYSCNLIRNDVPFRWRGRYNEDTDLSLRMLKASWCTVLFNVFLQKKMATQTIKGGNTDTIYKKGTLAKSQLLVKLHSDVARLMWRYGREHHYVNYDGFTQPLVRKAAAPARGVNNYGMQLVRA